METILRIPRAIIGSILNAESDWIRYGLPALLLTIIFSAMMVSKQSSTLPAQPASPQSSSPSQAAERPHRVIQHLHGPRNPLPGQPGVSPPAMPMAESRPPATDTSINAEARQKQLAAEAAKWGWKEEGRRALCDATRASIPDFKAGTLHKHYTIHLARANFRGDRTMADKAVDQALIDYQRNVWDESQCPDAPGQPRMPKGAIDAVIKRKQDWFKSH